MKRDKVFNAIFCGIIGGVCLYIPVHFMLVHIGVVTKTSNDNQVVFEPVVAGRRNTGAACAGFLPEPQTVPG